jgi:GT2 family glycosyltransferase
MATKVLDVEVREAGSVPVGGHAAVDVLFRSGRDPIARLRIPCSGDRLDLAPFAARAADSVRSARPRLPAGPLPTVSVVICTRDRPAELAALLRSLARQEVSPHEVVVVENAATVDVSGVVRGTLPSARFVREPRPGLDIARNRALELVSGELVAFTDDDVELDPGWVRAVAEAFAGAPEAGGVTGLILPLELETPAQELFERNVGYSRGLERRVLPGDERRMLGLRLPAVSEVLTLGNGCNMAFRRTDLRALGGFDEALDTGRPLPGGGDLDMLYRVLRSGRTLVYEPRAIVRHRHRRSEQELRAQLVGHRRALGAFLVKTLLRESGRARLDAAAFLAWRSLKDALRLARGLAGRDVLPLGILARLLVAGLAGLGSYQASRRRVRGLATAPAAGSLGEPGG